LNHARPIFADRITRKALYHAVDREAIVRESRWESVGSLQVADGPIPPGSPAYLEGLPRLEYDPKKAQALLREAGWRDEDGDGILERDGKPFAFEVLYPANSRSRREALRIMLLNLREVGIRMTPRPVPLPEMISLCRRREYDAAFFFNSFMPRLEEFYRIKGKKGHPMGKKNMYSYRNEEVEKLIRKLSETVSAKGVDPLKRPDLIDCYHRIQRIFSEDLPCVFIWVQVAQTAVVHRRFGNVLNGDGRLNPFSLWVVDDRRR